MIKAILDNDQVLSKRSTLQKKYPIDQYPENWYQLEEELEALKKGKKTISLQDYEDLATKLYISNHRLLLEYFDDIGVVGYFEKLNKNEALPSTVSEEVQDAQVQFSSLIEIKRNELKQYKKDNPELVRDFEHQLVELQLNYKQLLPQLKDEKKRDVVLQAVIDNLQMQVEILNQQIEIVKQYKKPKNDTEEIVPL